MALVAKSVIAELNRIGSYERSIHSQRFFKTGPGQYGEGDVFIGGTVPEQRVIAQKYSMLSLSEVEKLLNSKIHEHRFTGLIILVHNYEKSKDDKSRLDIYNFYLSHVKSINNWDLVDVTAPNIVGNYLVDNKKKRDVLYKLVTSSNIWERRIAIISTLSLIRNKEFDDTLALSEILLSDKHDLMHKATGWMLREVGKRDEKVLRKFLDKHIRNLPRTTLRYAIERFDEKTRKEYLKK